MEVTHLQESEFLETVKDHMIMVVGDAPNFRHLHFTRQDSNIASFDIVTWPGHLAYTGDMGSFVFKQSPDMFKFFRADPAIKLPEGQTLQINPGYWAEKLVAVDKDDGDYEEFSPEVFRQRITECLDDVDASIDIRQLVAEQVLPAADDGETAALDAANAFEVGDFRFDGLSEIDFCTFSYRYLWCCYAIVWAIGYYDDMVKANDAEREKQGQLQLASEAVTV